jgi:hypothetical protein
MPSDPAASGKTERPTAPESATGPRRSESGLMERRAPSSRETLATLPSADDAEVDFEPHDTIPAPTWLEDESAPTHKAP